MQKERQREDFLKELNENTKGTDEVLPEIKRRKRKAFGEHSLENVSYKSLLQMHFASAK